MATIKKRTRADGSIAYTAQVKVWRGGKLVLTKAATFDREATAKAWAKRKEAEFAKPGAVEAARRPKGTVADLIDKYVATSRREMGKTKAQVLETIKGHGIGTMAPEDLAPAVVVEYARELGATRKPQTVQNYLSHLSAVLRVARTGFGADVDRDLMADALDSAKRLGLVSKSAERDRRPTLDELDRLMAHFVDRSRRRGALPMHRIVAFAIFSTRRQEEITRLRRADLEAGRLLVRDMKHPGEKVGNDVWCGLVPEAEAIARAMPEGDVLFPYEAGSVSAAFTRACKVLGIVDLHFHDMRHEGVSRLFEMGWTIPRVAEVSGHRSWQSLQRYTQFREVGDKYAGWPWLSVVTSAEQGQPASMK